MVITPESLPHTLDNVIFLQELDMPLRVFIEEGLRWGRNHLKVFENVLMQLINYYLEHDDIKPCNLLDNSLYMIVDDCTMLGCGRHEYSYSVSADGDRYDCHRCMPFENNNILRIPELYKHNLEKAGALHENCSRCPINVLCNCCPASNASIKDRPQAAVRCQMVKILHKAQAYFFLNMMVKNPHNPMIEQYSGKQRKEMIAASEIILRRINPLISF